MCKDGLLYIVGRIKRDIYMYIIYVIIIFYNFVINIKRTEGITISPLSLEVLFLINVMIVGEKREFSSCVLTLRVRTKINILTSITQYLVRDLIQLHLMLSLLKLSMSFQF